ncbi:hypothetical protein NC653_029242 [Populus alba x Populus x berolinensis]|uniref:Uncharacterized protein n=1 Tax=Populus alba x Populus x berolinensis TaxID=444605 RepID=A0AAD6M1M0_9ROSI|nr:hypothetical protein NC653_029242 [Populus alba x Populus x berolinensis]
MYRHLLVLITTGRKQLLVPHKKRLLLYFDQEAGSLKAARPLQQPQRTQGLPESCRKGLHSMEIVSRQQQSLQRY